MQRFRLKPSAETVRFPRFIWSQFARAIYVVSSFSLHIGIAKLTSHAIILCQISMSYSSGIVLFGSKVFGLELLDLDEMKLSDLLSRFLLYICGKK